MVLAIAIIDTVASAADLGACEAHEPQWLAMLATCPGVIDHGPFVDRADGVALLHLCLMSSFIARVAERSTTGFAVEHSCLLLALFALRTLVG